MKKSLIVYLILVLLCAPATSANTQGETKRFRSEWLQGGGEKSFDNSRIDRLLIEALPVTGTYLVVLRKAAENMRSETVTFKATDRGR